MILNSPMNLYLVQPISYIMNVIRNSILSCICPITHHNMCIHCQCYGHTLATCQHPFIQSVRAELTQEALKLRGRDLQDFLEECSEVELDVLLYSLGYMELINGNIETKREKIQYCTVKLHQVIKNRKYLLYLKWQEIHSINIVIEEKVSNGNVECPICFDSVSPDYKVVTSCGHAFCSKCIIRCMNMSNVPPNSQSSLFNNKCPLCRSAIDHLVFNNESVRECFGF